MNILKVFLKKEKDRNKREEKKRKKGINNLIKKRKKDNGKGYEMSAECTQAARFL